MYLIKAMFGRKVRIDEQQAISHLQKLLKYWTSTSMILSIFVNMNIKYTLISICQSMAYISALYTLYVVMANKPVDEHSTHLTIVNVGVLRNFSAILAPFIAEMKHQKNMCTLCIYIYLLIISSITVKGGISYVNYYYCRLKCCT